MGEAFLVRKGSCGGGTVSKGTVSGSSNKVNIPLSTPKRGKCFVALYHSYFSARDSARAFLAVSEGTGFSLSASPRFTTEISGGNSSVTITSLNRTETSVSLTLSRSYSYTLNYIVIDYD